MQMEANNSFHTSLIRSFGDGRYIKFMNTTCIPITHIHACAPCATLHSEFHRPISFARVAVRLQPNC